jgi:hypothetical protein
MPYGSRGSFLGGHCNLLRLEGSFGPLRLETLRGIDAFECWMSPRWSVFALVHEKIGTRYSGHLFSRLAVCVAQYDQTKTVAYYMRGKAERSFKVNGFLSTLKMAKRVLGEKNEALNSHSQ